MSRCGRAARALAVVACTLCACCDVARAEASFTGYSRPRAVVVDDALHLFATVSGTDTCVYVRRDPKGEWSEPRELRGNPSCVAHGDGLFCLFLPKAKLVAFLDAKDCEKKGQVRWPWEWHPEAATVADGVLTAFGVSQERLYRASRPMAVPLANEEAEAPNAGWTETLIHTEGEGTCRAVRILPVGDRLWVFWTEEDSDGAGHVLQAATFDGEAPVDPTRLGRFRGPIQFAPVVFLGKPLIIYGALPGRLSEGRRLVHRTYAEGHWSSFERVRALGNTLAEETHGLSAASVDGAVHLFLATQWAGKGQKAEGAGRDAGLRVLATTYNGVAWTPPEDVLSDPQVAWILDHTIALLAVAGAGAALLVVSLIRSRSLPRQAHIAGVSYLLAPWWQRGGAHLFDFLLVWLGVRAMYTLAGQPLTTTGLVVAVFLLELFYFAVCETRSGRTLGKRLFGLIVVSRNGGYPNWAEAVVRNLPRAVVDALVLIPIGWLVASVFILNTRGSQRVGDLVAGTYVVKEHTAA